MLILFSCHRLPRPATFIARARACCRLTRRLPHKRGVSTCIRSVLNTTNRHACLESTPETDLTPQMYHPPTPPTTSQSKLPRTDKFSERDRCSFSTVVRAIGIVFSSSDWRAHGFTDLSRSPICYPESVCPLGDHLPCDFRSYCHNDSFDDSVWLSGGLRQPIQPRSDRHSEGCSSCPSATATKTKAEPLGAVQGLGKVDETAVRPPLCLCAHAWRGDVLRTTLKRHIYSYCMARTSVLLLAPNLIYRCTVHRSL